MQILINVLIITFLLLTINLLNKLEYFELDILEYWWYLIIFLEQNSITKLYPVILLFKKSFVKALFLSQEHQS